MHLEMTPEDIERLIIEEAAYFRMVAEVEREDHALFLNSPLLPEYADVNRALRIRLEATDSEDPGAKIRSVLKWFEQKELNPVIDLDPLAISQGVSNYLLSEGLVLDTVPRSLMKLPEMWREPAIASEAEVIRLNEPDSDARSAWVKTAIFDDIGTKYESLWETVSRHEAEHPGVTLFLALIEGKPVGCCSLFLHEGWGRIESVIVKKGYRRRGVASALVLIACKESLAKGATTTFLYAEKESAAERLYQKLGFEIWATNFFQRYST